MPLRSQVPTPANVIAPEGHFLVANDDVMLNMLTDPSEWRLGGEVWMNYDS